MSTNDANPASIISQSEQTGGTHEKKKKGLKKLRSSISGAFGGKKRRRRRKKSGSGSLVSGDSGSYDSYSASGQSADDAALLRNSGTAPTTTAAQQEWIQASAGLAEMAAISESRGNNSRTNSAGGRGHSLAKIAELPEEEDGDYDSPAARRRRTHKRRGNRSDASSIGSKRSIGSFFGRTSSSSETPKADPLSLVVLLVEPASLRFELLSLDFDLTPKKSGRKSRSRKSNEAAGPNKTKNKLPELQLTVQDVLDQITPDSLTDETLKQKAATPGSCQGLIDRTGTVHFGGSSLEAACASRPLRAFDTALAQQKNNPLAKVLLSVPTYSGEPHKDVLLGFFGNPPHPNDDIPSGILSHETQEGVANALELARPIFADSNVVGLMESSGYNLKGWKPKDANNKPTKLGKPLPPPARERKSKTSPVRKALLGLLAILLATILAWSVVAGGLHYLPSIVDGGDASNDGGPSTLEGHVLWAYQSAKDWYSNRTTAAAY